MKEIINLNSIKKELERQNLNVDNVLQFKKYISNFNYNTLIGGFSDIFYFDAEKKKYDNEASTSQIINAYEFDRNVGNALLINILYIEKKINTYVAYTIINVYQLDDKCLLGLDEQFLKQKIFTNIDVVPMFSDFDNFIFILTKHCDNNDLTKRLKIKNRNYDLKVMWSQVPLDLMCLTWSFATTFNTFQSLDNTICSYILDNFNIKSRSVSGFIDFVRNLLQLRNAISHNLPVFNITVKYQSESLNKLYKELTGKTVRVIGIMELIVMIQEFSENPKLLSKIKIFYNNLNIKEKFKKKIPLFVTTI